MEKNDVRLEVYRRQRNMALDAMAELETTLTLRESELEQCREHIAELEKFREALVDKMPVVT